MRNLDALAMRYFGLIAAAVSFVLLVTAHSFELFGGFTPCHLCLEQRMVHWSCVGAGLVIALAGRPRVRTLGLYVLVVAYAFGAALAGFHIAVEHHWIAPPPCPPDLGDAAAGPFDVALDKLMQAIAGLFGWHKATLQESLSAMLNGQTHTVVACDKPGWWFLGLTMAGWNAVICLVMALACLRAALWRPRAS